MSKRLQLAAWRLVGAVLLCCQAFAAPRTNLVVIMSDDQGAWSMGCYGNAEAHTPVLDQLAADGVRMSRAFATTPVCSPSRATYFTGRIPSQHGIHDWIKHENIGPRARYCMADEVTLSDILRDFGYTCGLVGKWHLGGNMSPQAGFTYWYTLPKGSSQYQDAEVVWEGKFVKTKGYLTDRITDKAVDFLNLSKDKPFYLEVQYNAPHSPWTGHPQELVDLWKDSRFASIPKVPVHPWASVSENLIGQREPMSQYFAACAGIDRGVGRILDHLRQLGLMDNTLVVYTSDQGFNIGHHGVWGKGNGTNPRNMYDTSLRVPMIFYQAGKLTGGRVVDTPASAYDFVPTLLDCLDLPPSPGRNLPGHSFAPFLTGGSVENWPDAVYGEYGHTRMIRTAQRKYVHRADGGPLELYDLQADPDEADNLADKPEHRALLVQLRTELFKWFEDYVEAGSDPVGQEYIRRADRK